MTTADATAATKPATVDADRPPNFRPEDPPADAAGRPADGVPPSAARRVVDVAVSALVIALAVWISPLPLVGLAVAATCAISLEVLWPLHDRTRSRRALVTDLTHAVGNRAPVLAGVFALLSVLGPVVVWATPHALVDAVHGLPGWAQAAVVFPLTDLASYLGHRALHRIPLLWRLHRVHHSSEHLDWIATSRVHPLDLAVNISAATLPAAALGYVDEQPWLLTILFLYPFFVHANARWRMPVLDKIIVSPAFHHWHHAADPAAHDHNFGAFFSIWDRLFGTSYEPGGFPSAYGIGDPGLDAADYTGHLLSPFTRR